LLPKSYQSLIRSPNLRKYDAVPFSDGLIFSELSLGLFDSLEKQEIADSEIVHSIAEGLLKYYTGDRALLQPTSGALLRASRPMRVEELAILSQNKAYEHTASEFEEHIFARGGRNTSLDPLDGASTYQRLQKIGEGKLFYYERRNFLRHRAHKDSYRLYAELLQSHRLLSDDQFILRRVLNHLNFFDVTEGQERINLFDDVRIRFQEKDIETREEIFHSVEFLLQPHVTYRTDLRQGGHSNSNSVAFQELQKLIQKPVDRYETYQIVKKITSELINSLEVRERIGDNPILVPILRAGLPMWDAVNIVLKHPQSVFINASKSKGTDRVDVSWSKCPDLSGRNILLLDTIIASGDTVTSALKMIKEFSSEQARVCVMSCYVSPEGLEKVLVEGQPHEVIIGGIAERVDENGYLVPMTHGDLGDRLFG
jgi:uracil phosphoribosyltransferase